MKLTKKEKEMDAESLRKLGLTEEEIEGFFEFFEDAKEYKSPRRIRVLNIKKIKLQK